MGTAHSEPPSLEEPDAAAELTAEELAQQEHEQEQHAAIARAAEEAQREFEELPDDDRISSQAAPTEGPGGSVPDSASSVPEGAHEETKNEEIKIMMQEITVQLRADIQLQMEQARAELIGGVTASFDSAMQDVKASQMASDAKVETAFLEIQELREQLRGGPRLEAPIKSERSASRVSPSSRLPDWREQNKSPTGFSLEHRATLPPIPRNVTTNVKAAKGWITAVLTIDESHTQAGRPSFTSQDLIAKLASAGLLEDLSAHSYGLDTTIAHALSSAQQDGSSAYVNLKASMANTGQNDKDTCAQLLSRFMERYCTDATYWAMVSSGSVLADEQLWDRLAKVSQYDPDVAPEACDAHHYVRVFMQNWRNLPHDERSCNFKRALAMFVNGLEFPLSEELLKAINLGEIPTLESACAYIKRADVMLKAGDPKYWAQWFGGQISYISCRTGKALKCEKATFKSVVRGQGFRQPKAPPVPPKAFSTSSGEKPALDSGTGAPTAPTRRLSTEEWGKLSDDEKGARARAYRMRKWENQKYEGMSLKPTPLDQKLGRGNTLCPLCGYWHRGTSCVQFREIWKRAGGKWEKRPSHMAFAQGMIDYMKTKKKQNGEEYVPDPGYAKGWNGGAPDPSEEQDRWD